MVAAAPTIAICNGADFDALLPLLDQEFIFGKGRLLSLQQRFPATIDRKHPRNILVASSEGVISSALATKPFNWITPQRSWRAAMIGMVYTRPELRGRGTASALLRAAQEKLAQQSYAFAVLWTTQPDFYARLGWTAMDCGVLGSAQSSSSEAIRPAPPPGATDIAWIEAMRIKFAPERVERNTQSYATLLPHAQRLELLRGDAAYALIGTDDKRGYLYEMLGDVAELAALWAGLAPRYRTLYLNLPRNAPARFALSAYADISWQPQRLAMWLPLSAEARAAHFADWYIPFLDRI